MLIINLTKNLFLNKIHKNKSKSKEKNSAADNLCP